MYSRGMRFAYASLAALFAFVALVPGCTTKTCTLLDCRNSLVGHYAASVNGAYTLTLTTSGYASGSIACPTASEVAAPAGSFDFVSCDANGFTLTWASTQTLGGNPTGITSIAITGTVTANGATSTVQSAAGQKGITQPNGPECDPTCTSYDGMLVAGHS